MKKILLGTNWKMYKTLTEATNYTTNLLKITNNYPKIQFFVIPSYTILWHIKELIGDGNLLLGAQNMHYEDEGPFTGEVSPTMLKDIGLDIIELGHSERRQYYNENDYVVNKKTISALKHGFTPLVCIGENAIEKDYNITSEKVRSQVKIVLTGISAEDVKRVWLAYEPIWAIGARGIPASPEYVEEVHGIIRNMLIELYGEEVARDVTLLYGGSVNPENALSIIQRKDVDGLFIGRSAWDLRQFQKIINDVDKYIESEGL